MESLASLIPLILLILAIVVVIRWRKSVQYLKNPPPMPLGHSQSSDEQQNPAIAAATYQSSVSVTSVSVGDKEIDLQVAEEEVESLMKEWSFLWEYEKPKQLKGTEAWYKQRNQNKFLKEEPDRALDWLLPFIPRQAADHEQVRPYVEKGPDALYMVISTLRALAKESRKANQPRYDLLQALYGALVAHDFARSIAEIKLGAYGEMGIFTGLSELEAKPADYRKIGYEQLNAGLKTDRKWFVEEFGEPDEHVTVKEYFADAWRATASRRCWKALQQHGGLTGTTELKKANIQAWLRDELKKRIVLERAWGEENRQQVAARAERVAVATARASGPPPGYKSMSFYTERVAGVSFDNPGGTARQKLIGKLQDGEAVYLVRDPDNKNDPSAIKVLNKDRRQLGFINKLRTAELAPQMDSDYKVEAWVDKITGGGPDESLGLIVGIQRYKPVA